ncbi:MAG: DUF2142 domain-containing protein [Erysipelotrichaceae bacterium]|nr:DUF2142 domain-containing protein [Erysipelotrichaceae bacterium]
MKTADIKNRLKKNFAENKILLSIFLILWIALIIYTLNAYQTTLGKLSVGNESYDRSVAEVNEKVKIETVVSAQQDTESVSILFATYARTNSGNVTIKIENDTTKEIYASETIDVDRIIDNDYRTIRLNHVLSDTDWIKVTISSDSSEGQGVGVYYSNAGCFDDSVLVINEDRIDNADLCLKYLIHNDELKGFSSGIIVFTIFGLTFLALLLLLFDPSREVLFTCAVLILGIIMMIIIVPASPPDELSHYEVALQVSNMMMFTEQRTIDSIYLKYGYMYGHYNISAGYVRFIREIFQPLKPTGKTQTLSRDALGVYWIQYIPNAIGLTLGRLLKLNMITTFYLGRITSLVFYAVCIYFAIRLTPTLKSLLGIISIMPMFLQTAASISYDTFILGLSFLSVSFFLRWYFSEEKILAKEYIIVFIICLLLAPAKVVYGFFSFLFFFVPAKRFGSTKKKILITLLLCLPAAYQLYDIMAGPLKLLFKSILHTDTENLISLETRNIGIRPDKTIYSFSYMIHHPWETLMIFYRTIRYRIKFWFYGSFCRALSGDTLIIPIGIVHLVTIILFTMSFVSQPKTLPFLLKTVFVLMCIVIGLYVIIGMFVSWTESSQSIVEDYGGVIVEGIQGRYFSPLLPFFFAVFSNKKLALPQKFEKYTFLAYLMVFFQIVVYVLSYTFVN